MKQIVRTFPFLGSLLLLALALEVSSVQGANDSTSEVHRGGLVGWARLITPNQDWAVHSDRDPKLASFIRSQTSLNIDPVWYGVAPNDVNALCTYPFIYAKDLTHIQNQQDLQNIQEYLKRGGFLFIDPCVSRLTDSDKLKLIQNHARLFKALLPDCTVRELPDDHEIYRCYFSVTVDALYTPDMIRTGRIKKPHIGLRGVFRNDRMVAVICTDGLECGWPETPQREPGCIQMIVNSYIYAMTR